LTNPEKYVIIRQKEKRNEDEKMIIALAIVLFIVGAGFIDSNLNNDNPKYWRGVLGYMLIMVGAALLGWATC
jgi:hypothetical protein